MNIARFTAAALCLLLAGPATAQYFTDDPPAPDYPGNTLLNNTYVPSESELISHALAMEPVQMAVQELSGLGFQYWSSASHAWAGQDSAIVVLGYQFASDPNVFGFVLIRTLNSAWGATTKIDYGAYYRDPASGAVTAPTQASLSVLGTSSISIDDMKASGTSNYRRERSAVLRTLDFVECLVGNCALATGACALTGPGQPLCAVVACHVLVFYCAFSRLE